MRLLNPNVPGWFVELDEKDKESIQAHLDAGWQKESPKRTSAKTVKAVTETSSASTTEGENISRK